MVDKNILIQELVNKQRKKIYILNKLSFKEFLRIVKNIDTSLFCKNNCCVWKGYHITKNNKKYINFFFHQKKKLLKRLLYINYIDTLENNEYIKTTCGNPLCCNINHLEKKNKFKKKKIKENKLKKNNKVINNKKKIIIFFD